MLDTFLRLLGRPFMYLGIIWQFVAGSFEAGRMVEAAWIHGRVERMFAAAKSRAIPATEKH